MENTDIVVHEVTEAQKQALAASLAKKLGLSPQEVLYRLKSLEERGGLTLEYRTLGNEGAVFAEFKTLGPPFPGSVQ
eukprot:gene11794-13754_t